MSKCFLFVDVCGFVVLAMFKNLSLKTACPSLVSITALVTRRHRVVNLEGFITKQFLLLSMFLISVKPGLPPLQIHQPRAPLSWVSLLLVYLFSGLGNEFDLVHAG